MTEARPAPRSTVQVNARKHGQVPCRFAVLLPEIDHVDVRITNIWEKNGFVERYMTENCQQNGLADKRASESCGENAHVDE